jgi:hypothetical protein
MKKILYIFTILTIYFSLPTTCLTQTDCNCFHEELLLPSLSYTISNSRPGQITKRCTKRMIENAKAKGFTTATLMPTVAYNYKKNEEYDKILKKNKDILEPSITLYPREISNCLNNLWDFGLNIVYQPHLDSLDTLTGEGEKTWRASFNFDPLRNGSNGPYYKNLFEDFFVFLKKNKENIKQKIKQNNRQIDIVISAELEKSTITYPSQWKKLTLSMKKRLAEFELGELIKVGYNPNWRPAHDNWRNYKEFNSFIKELDFIAPSFYGNWTTAATSNSDWKSVSDIIHSSLKRICREDSQNKCRIPEIMEKQLSIGELGTGLYMNYTSAAKPQKIFDVKLGKYIESNYPISSMEKSHWIDKRRMYYKNILEWAKNYQNDKKNRNFTLNIYTLHIHDPVNVFDEKTLDPVNDIVFKSRPIPDPDANIKNMFISYSKTRNLVLKDKNKKSILSKFNQTSSFDNSRNMKPKEKIPVVILTWKELDTIYEWNMMIGVKIYNEKKKQLIWQFIELITVADRWYSSEFPHYNHLHTKIKKPDGETRETIGLGRVKLTIGKGPIRHYIQKGNEIFLPWKKRPIGKIEGNKMYVTEKFGVNDDENKIGIIKYYDKDLISNYTDVLNKN